MTHYVFFNHNDIPLQKSEFTTGHVCKSRLEASAVQMHGTS